jgi:hypothetical protein
MASLLFRDGGIYGGHTIKVIGFVARLGRFATDRNPTEGSVKLYAELKARLDGIVKEYDVLISWDVAEFNRAAQAAKTPLVAPAPKIER